MAVTDLKRLENLPGPDRADQADILKAASVVDLEAHRFLQLVRNHYGRGDLHPADAREVVQALEQAGDILRRQRRTLRESSRDSTVKLPLD